MALFKISKGLAAALPTTYTQGFCYVTTDDGKFYIDTTDIASGRICLNAAQADILKTARTLTIGATEKTFNGSANVAWTLAEIGAVNKAGDTMTGNLIMDNKKIQILGTQYPRFELIAQTANSATTFSLATFQGYYTDNVAMWIQTNKDDSTKSRRGLVLYGYGEQSNPDLAIALRQCDTAGTWLSNLYVLHSGNFDNYALPLTGGTLTGNLTAPNVYGAVWNDYAEFRNTKETIEPGRVVVENGDDTLSLSNSRLQGGANIVSDTFGFAIGETEECTTPIAVSGRVLAYTNEPRETFLPGEPVCSGPRGTVSRMSRQEVALYPDRIIGTVSAVPDYETWGTGNVKINGRIWIKV